MGAIKTTIVLGLGNVLCGDDGFGVHVAARLAHNRDFPPGCRVIDGGTQGQLLYGLIEEADTLLLIDAADLGLAPGSVAVLGDADIPKWLATGKLGAHQSSFSEVLALGSLKNVLPEEISLIGLQPVCVEFGKTLSPQAREGVACAEVLALDWLNRRGIAPKPAAATPAPVNRELLSAFFGS